MARRQQSLEARELAAAKKRQRDRKKKGTVPAGLALRQRQLTSARRELATIRGTGVARGAQLKRAQLQINYHPQELKRFSPSLEL